MSGLEREEWMLGEEFPFDADSKAQQDLKKKRKEASEQKISTKELNPVLRATLAGSDQPTKPAPATGTSIEWTAVLVKRAVQTIESGGASFESVACERFGSVEAFKAALKAVEMQKGIRYNLKMTPQVDTRTQTQMPLREHGAAEAPKEPESLADADMNKLTAKKIKAELAGDFETVRRLEREMEASKASAQKAVSSLTLLPREVYGRTKKPEADMSIAELMKHEKLASRHELDREFGLKYSAGSDEDEVTAKFTRVDKTSRHGEQPTKIDAAKKYQRSERIRSECRFCDLKDHWIIARGYYTYLAVPRSRSLSQLHCLIVPREHCGSFMDCRESEEEVWEEVRNFKKCLLRMAASRDRSYVFMECALRPEDERRHAFIDCIPTPKGMTSASDLRGYFKQALSTADEEWSQNRKIIETGGSASSGLRSKLPRNRSFPYFYVDFRLDEGYAHVIEDGEKFGNDDFGRELMATTVLRIPRDRWRNYRTTDEDKASFKHSWQPFDWTKDVSV